VLRVQSARSQTHQASPSAHDPPCFSALMILKEGLTLATGGTLQGAALAYPAALAHTPMAQVLPTCPARAARPRMPLSRKCQPCCAGGVSHERLRRRAPCRKQLMHGVCGGVHSQDVNRYSEALRGRA
jgi:hypothetical protein